MVRATKGRGQTDLRPTAPSDSKKPSTSKRKSDHEEPVEETSNKKKRTRAHTEDKPRVSQSTSIFSSNDGNKTNDGKPLDKYMDAIQEILIQVKNDQSAGGAHGAGLELVDQTANDRIAKLEKEKEDLTAQLHIVSSHLKERENESNAQAQVTALRLKETKESLELAKFELKKRTEKSEVLESDVKEQEEAARRAQFAAKQKAEEAKRYHAGNLALVRENNKLDEENIRLQDEVRQLREEICDIGNELADKKLDYDKTCDDTITEDWSHLFFLVRQAVANHMRNPPPVERERICQPNEHTNDIVSLSQRTKDVSPGYQMYCFQGYIWRRLHKDIFEGHKATWAGPVAEAFYIFSRHLGEAGAHHLAAAETLSEIKSNTAHQIDGQFGVDESTLEGYINNLAQDLGAFVTQDDLDMTFKNRMSEIVHLADKLRVAMMKSRAFFRISWTSCTGKTVASTKVAGGVEVCFQEALPQYQEQTVLHVVSPQLWKQGLADGRGFEHKTLLGDAVVVASDPRTEEEVRQAEKEIQQADLESSDDDGEEDGCVVASEHAKEEADEDANENSESSYKDSDSCTAAE